MNAAAGNTPGSRRGTADLERDGDAIRADMDRTLEALESRFSPREVVDRSMGYLQEHGAVITRRVMDTVRENPIPVAVTAAGLMWLATSIARSGSAAAREESESLDEDEVLDEEDMEAQRWSEDEPTDRDDAGNTRIVGHRLARSGRFVRKRVDQARHTVSEFVGEQPLVLGMLAVAAGALLGTMLPDTEYERRAVSGAQRSSGPGELT